MLLLHAEMELYFASLTEESWQEELDYRNMKGDEFRHSREEMLFTVVNHASYHRGKSLPYCANSAKPESRLIIFISKENR
ncbi:DinB family protein [Planococcus sp. MB-3u-03]|uniref:DinB family protein n=1 Tax=Planococcus sp. MB-3u-03 TaxID=2058136 RepID=UPI001E5AC678|nr:hypothetical protein [Planococcus sp. MB-3u-03]